MRFRPVAAAIAAAATVSLAASALPAQQFVNETRDPHQAQYEDFAKDYAKWTSGPEYGSPLVDHLPKVKGIPTPQDVLGYYIGAPAKLTYYADIVKYYRALAKATPRVKVETIGRSDEGRELVVVWVSSEENIRNLAQNRANLAKLADPRGLSKAEIQHLIQTTKPNYHLMGGLHSGETGPSEMLMELAYRLATETSPLITNIRNNVVVSITPAADPDGRDRNVDWFYHGLDMGPDTAKADSAANGRGGGPGGGRGGSPAGQLPYWGKYVYHDNNRDINLSQTSMRAITDWYFTAHPPIMHDLHESLSLMYDYSGGPPQNPNLDPILFSELPFYANWELEQMTKYGMPGVYTHAFMDGWSPGYLGSVAYNHNGMMRMYETQSGREMTKADSVRVKAIQDSVARAMQGLPPLKDSTTARGGRGFGGRGGRGGASGGRGGAPAESTAARGRGAGAPGAPGGGRGAPGGGRGAPGGGRGGAEFGGPANIPTGKGGGQPREWYRGLPIPPDAILRFTRRNNTNYMETGVLSGLELTAMFPQVVLQNFYTKTEHSIDAGKTEAPYGYVIPVAPDMTRAATLVNVLRAQGIEVGKLEKETTIGTEKFPAGSYVIKLDQPYGRLAKNLLEKQDYPDPALTTYDDSGWSMGYAFNVDVKEIKDKSILNAAVTPVKTAEVKGTVAGNGTAGLAVAHYGSNNMITFRYKLKNVPMKVAEKEFTADGVKFPAGSFIVTGSPAELQAAKAAVESLGLTAAALSSVPTVATHDANVPRIAIYSQWNGTQELGWYRFTFDKFGIPYDLIYKERVAKGDLKKDYDVILMAAQNINRAAVLAKKAARPQPYEQSAKYKFLGMYGSTPDMSGGFGAEGVDAINKFLDEGGTLITTLQAVRYPIEFGLARSVDTENPAGVVAQKPLIQAEIKRTDSPVFYGYADKIFPIKFGQGSQVFRVGIADQSNVLADYVGGNASVLSGLMTGADNLKGRAFVVDIPNAYDGHGRVLMFANNPIYRWQNHGEFNMIFNSIINWDDPTPTAPLTLPAATTNTFGRGGGSR
ncbi:MAG TPA: M14 family zinc carboxypeptidase [Gemmatimonadaceae bacterium]|nr:M14 family zinc carboxypeptidase [Gemmatimonadaceae bacterium]